MKKISVGISFYFRSVAYQSIWENGLNQNIVFLAKLLQNVPEVQSVCIINASGGDEENVKRLAPFFPCPVLDLQKAINTCDVVIEAGVILCPEIVAHVRARGGKSVSMRCGNDYVIDIERMMHDKPAGNVINGSKHDEVWTIPEYLHSCVEYFGALYRAPVAVVPHIWESLMLDLAPANHPQPLQYGYQPKPGLPWSVGVFEPNVSMVKTSFIPMVACDLAYQRNPAGIAAIYPCNTQHLTQQNAFVQFCERLISYERKVMHLQGRPFVYEALSGQINAVFSHHWENGQNYLYYEALHGDYPLIHNSDFLQGAGYHYHGFDVEEGATALLHAIAVHDLDLDNSRAKAKQMLYTLALDNPVNIAAYRERLLGLFAKK